MLLPRSGAPRLGVDGLYRLLEVLRLLACCAAGEFRGLSGVLHNSDVRLVTFRGALIYFILLGFDYLTSFLFSFFLLLYFFFVLFSCVLFLFLTKSTGRVPSPVLPSHRSTVYRVASCRVEASDREGRPIL